MTLIFFLKLFSSYIYCINCINKTTHFFEKGKPCENIFCEAIWFISFEISALFSPSTYTYTLTHIEFSPDRVVKIHDRVRYTYFVQSVVSVLRVVMIL